MGEAMGGGTEPHAIADKRVRKLANEPPKDASDTCLQCHAGREEHNSYRQGEHWRNDVGCTDCHFAHAPDPAPPRGESHTLVATRTRQAPDSYALRMLKGNEARLCLRCHAEQRAQFSMPFRHKVLEGLVKCSDCHNPHGTQNPRLLKRPPVFQLCVECHTNGYTRTRLTTEAEILYFAGLPGSRFATGRSLFYLRDSFFYFNAVARLHGRVTAYRVNDDHGQGSRVTNDAGGVFIRSLPFVFQTPRRASASSSATNTTPTKRLRPSTPDRTTAPTSPTPPCASTSARGSEDKAVDSRQ